MSASLKIDLTQVPFSARGSFLAVSQLPAHWQGLPNAAGLYLRTVRHDVQTPLIAQISLPDEEFDAAIEHAGLTLTGASLRVECCFAGPEALLFRGNGSVTLDFLAETGAYDYLYAVEADSHLLWMANCYKNNKQYLIRVEQGTAEPDQCWQESTALYARFRISGAPDFLFEIREIACEWDPLQPPPDFDRSKAETERDYLAFEVGLPESAPCFQELLHQALFINWSSLVRPEGFLKRESMYMSKNWMTNVWSWDHCFNAMALCRDHPSLAWDQWMIMADFQDGYWRGPIWAPSTLMLIDGLIRCGEQCLAREVSERFVAMTEKSGFAENYDALTGEGLRDRAYTWTASTAMILVREILSMNR